KALQREREDLHQQLMQVDRIIKRVKGGNYSPDTGETKQIEVKAQTVVEGGDKALPYTDNLKVQVLRVFDLIGKATKLKTIQEEYSKITGNKYHVREAVRSLQAAGLVKLIRQKGNERGFMWIKAQWFEDGQLLDEYKPEGFDLLYKPENLIYE